jgi:hypothetical protein
MSQDDDWQRLPASWGRLFLVVAAVVAGWLGWRAWFDPKIQFLPPGPATWILYPSPPEIRGIAAVELPAEFHGQLVLAAKPAQAELDWRCFRRGEVFINGRPVEGEVRDDWKNMAHVEVGDLLRQGTNDITATIFAITGPPALSLRLRSDAGTVATDERWDVSLAGALRLPAARAGDVVEPRRGNAIFGAERVSSAVRAVFGKECLFLVASMAVVVGWLRVARRGENWLRILGFGGLALLWLTLVAHNIESLTEVVGFDAVRHLEYVQYVQTHHSLPLANQGWEMYQAPLYYVVSSGLLNLWHYAVNEVAGLRVLRGLNLLVGAANVGFVFGGLRVLFPGDWKKQLAGTTLAAFAPWHLYLLHYTTNEALAAMLGTASLWFCLKALQAGASPWWRAGLGVALGLACLAKASAIVLLPVVFVALAGPLMARRERSPAAWGMIVLVFGLVAVIGGWHYWRMWRHFGSPLAGNWTLGVAPLWWQRPGYLTPRYFLSFGKALSDPFFSGYYSFWDGVYSTMWGDALWGGGHDLTTRAPWKYDLMTVGFVLALAPAFFVVTGAVVSLRRFVRRPRADWLLMIGLATAFLFAMALMTLKLPFYGQAKAFYALSALLPVSAIGVVGLDFWSGRSRGVCLAFLTICGMWLVNNYAAFWIVSARPVAPEPAEPGTLTLAQKAAYAAPDDEAAAMTWLGLAEGSGSVRDVVSAGEWYLRLDPFNPLVHAVMGNALERLGDTNGAAMQKAIGKSEK